MVALEYTKPTAIKRDLDVLEGEGGGFVEAVIASRMPMLITDAQESGNPVIFANGAFLKMLGLTQDEVIGKSYASVVSERSITGPHENTKERMASHIPSTCDLQLRRNDGRKIWVSQILDPIIKDGRIVRQFASFYDIDERVFREQDLRDEKGALERRINARTYRLQQTTERLEDEAKQRRRLETTLRDTLTEKEKDLRFRDFLLAEIQHRTANAFQVSASILSIQGMQSSPEIREALDLASERIIRVGEMHKLLAFQPSEPGLIHVFTYLERICHQTAEGLSLERVQMEVDVEELISWPSNIVIPLGLIVNEAIINALKHAFPNNRRGSLKVALQPSGGNTFRLRIEDDGVGMSTKQRNGSLGFGLIRMAAKQIKGQASMEAGTNGTGSVVTVEFPLPDNSAVL